MLRFSCRTHYVWRGLRFYKGDSIVDRVNHDSTNQEVLKYLKEDKVKMEQFLKNMQRANDNLQRDKDNLQGDKRDLQRLHERERLSHRRKQPA